MPPQSAYDEGQRAADGGPRRKWRMPARPRMATETMRATQDGKSEDLTKDGGANRIAAGCRDKPPPHDGHNSAIAPDRITATAAAASCHVGKTTTAAWQQVDPASSPQPGSLLSSPSLQGMTRATLRSCHSATPVSASRQATSAQDTNSATRHKKRGSITLARELDRTCEITPSPSTIAPDVVQKKKSKLRFFKVSSKRANTVEARDAGAGEESSSSPSSNMECSPQLLALSDIAMSPSGLSAPSSQSSPLGGSSEHGNFDLCDQFLAPPQPAFLRGNIARRGSGSSQQSERTSIDGISVRSGISASPSLRSSSSLTTAWQSYDATDQDWSSCSGPGSTSPARTPKADNGEQGSSFWKGIKRRLPSALSGTSPKGARSLRPSNASRKSTLVTSPFDAGALAPIDLTPQLPPMSRRSTLDLDSMLVQQRPTGQAPAPARVPVTGADSAYVLPAPSANTAEVMADTFLKSAKKANDELSDTSEDDYGVEDLGRDGSSTSACDTTTHGLQSPVFPLSPPSSEGSHSCAPHSSIDAALTRAPKRNSGGHVDSSIKDTSIRRPKSISPKQSQQPASEGSTATYTLADVTAVQKVVYAGTIMKMFPSLEKSAPQSSDRSRSPPLKQPRSMNKVKDLAAKAKTAGFSRDLRTMVALAQTARRLDAAIMTSAEMHEVSGFAAKHLSLADSALQDALKQDDIVAKALSASMNCFTVTGKEAKERPPLGQSMGLWLSRPPFASRVHNVVSADVAVAPLPEVDPKTGEIVPEKPRRARPQPLQFSMRCRALAIIGSGVSVNYAASAFLQPRTSSMPAQRRESPQRPPLIRQTPLVNLASQLPTTPEPKPTSKETRFATIEENDNSSDDEVPLALLSARYSVVPSLEARREEEERRLQAQVKLAEQRKKQQLAERQLAEHKRVLAEARARRQRTEHSAVLTSPTYGAGNPLFDPRRARRDKLAMSMYEQSGNEVHRFFGSATPALAPPSASSAIEVTSRSSRTLASSGEAHHSRSSLQREGHESRSSLVSSTSADKRQNLATSRSRTKLSVPATAPKTPSPLHSSMVVSSAPAKSTGFARENEGPSTPTPARPNGQRSSRITAPQPVYSRHSMVVGQTTPPRSASRGDMMYTQHSAVPLTSSPLADVTHGLNKMHTPSRTSRISGSKLCPTRVAGSASIDATAY